MGSADCLDSLAILEPLVRRAAQAGGAARELRQIHKWSEEEIQQEARIHALNLLSNGSWSPDEPVQHVMQRIKVKLIDRCREERRRLGYTDHRGFRTTGVLTQQDKANFARGMQRDALENASASDAVSNIVEGIRVIAEGVRYARGVIEARQSK